MDFGLGPRKCKVVLFREVWLWGGLVVWCLQALLPFLCTVAEFSVNVFQANRRERAFVPCESVRYSGAASNCWAQAVRGGQTDRPLVGLLLAGFREWEALVSEVSSSDAGSS